MKKNNYIKVLVVLAVLMVTYTIYSYSSLSIDPNSDQCVNTALPFKKSVCVCQSDSSKGCVVKSGMSGCGVCSD